MPDASHDFGAHLRQAREQRGISLREIADRTKISVLALEALERNDISRLPGGIFTRAFVRAYACEVGLDAEDTVRRFVARFPDASIEETPRAYEANPGHIEVDEAPTFGRAWRAVAWSLPLLVGVAYFGFGGRLPVWRDRAAQPAAKPAEQGRPPMPPPPAALTPLAANPLPAPLEGEAAQPGGVPTQGESSSAPGSVATGAASTTAVPAGAAPQVSAATPVVSSPGGELPAGNRQPPAPPTGTDGAAALPEDAFRITLAPRESCWVSVRLNGVSVYSGLLRPGDRKELALHGEVSLTVGNAGALGYLVNDEPGKSLGGPGQVVTARINARNLKTFVEPR